MSIFSKIFKRKPGGTMLGNLVRGVVKGVPIVGGFLGNGGMMITPEQAAERDAKEAAGLKANLPILNDGAKMQIGAGLAGAYENIAALSAPGTLPVPGAFNAGFAGQTPNPFNPYQQGAEQSVTKKYGIIAGVVAGALVLVLLIVKMFKK